MKFLANGDFYFPFDVQEYLYKHLYVWSYQNGALNFDGVFRFFLRLPNLLVFWLTDNLIVAYFYLLVCFTVAFYAFWRFSRIFLEIEDKQVRLSLSLFFAINPIFLGNAAKIGLVLAVSMLPLILCSMKQFFFRNRLYDLLLVILFLNISFLHPYTLAVNLLFVIGYSLIKLLKQGRKSVSYLPALFLFITLVLAAHAYIFLPVIGVGTVEKASILNTVSVDQKLDHSVFVRIANTSSMLYSFGMTKDVFIDFGFFDANYLTLYFVGSLALTIFLCFLTIRYYSSLPLTKRWLFISLLGLFLLLILLATGVSFGIDKLLVYLTNLPGGWIFRSPLKWQLYLPMALFGLLALLINTVPNRVKKISLMIIGVSFVLSNFYIASEVGGKLLKPRQVSYFPGLEQRFQSSKVLFVKNSECNNFYREHPNAVLELNQIIQSGEFQTKVAEGEMLNSMYLSDYGFFIVCGNQMLPTSLDVRLAEDFSDFGVSIYENRNQKEMVYVSNNTVGVKDAANFSYINDNPTLAVVETAQLDGNRVDADNVEINPLSLENLDINNDGVDIKPINLEPERSYSLYSRPSSEFLFTVSDYDSDSSLSIEDENVTGDNLYPNGSFEGEEILQAADCYNYDNTSLEFNGIKATYSDDAFEGNRSIQLEAQYHIGCFYRRIENFDPNADYLVSFNYKYISGKAPQVSFYPASDGNNVRSNLRAIEEWQSYSQIYRSGNFSEEMYLYFYLPTDGEVMSRVLFDNVRVVRVPRLPEMYLRTSEPERESVRTDWKDYNPTRYSVRLHELTEPRLLVFGETYNSEWQAEIIGDDETYVIPNHLIVNDYSNGWWFDPAALPASLYDSEGYYEIEIVFEPQKYFIGGLIASGTTYIGLIGYIIWSGRREKRGSYGHI